MAKTLDKPAIVRLFAGRGSAEGLAQELSLAVFAGLIAYADNKTLKLAISELEKRGVEPSKLHEVILQSYLFCGFPRMLEALFCLAEIIAPERYLESGRSDPSDSLAYTREEAARFESDGRSLIKKIYADKYERLQEAVWNMSPEVFRLMLIDGYGKTLSRPQLDVITRELAVVATLTVDGRVRQLQAHLRGALNVGATYEQLQETLEALSIVCENEKIQTALTLLREISSAA